MLLAHAGELHEETSATQSEHVAGQAVVKPQATARTLNPVTVVGVVVAIAIFVYVIYKLFGQKVS